MARKRKLKLGDHVTIDYGRDHQGKW